VIRSIRARFDATNGWNRRLHKKNFHRRFAPSEARAGTLRTRRRSCVHARRRVYVAIEMAQKSLFHADFCDCLFVDAKLSAIACSVASSASEPHRGGALSTEQGSL
jgi:hypothetical protein